MPGWGNRRCQGCPQYLADQLTLLQLGGGFSPPQYYWQPQIFWPSVIHGTAKKFLRKSYSEPQPLVPLQIWRVVRHGTSVEQGYLEATTWHFEVIKSSVVLLIVHSYTSQLFSSKQLEVECCWFLFLKKLQNRDQTLETKYDKYRTCAIITRTWFETALNYSSN